MKSANTDSLFITRKRKKWKFAHFDTWENCFSLSRNAKRSLVKNDIFSYLPKNKKLVIELAAGNAQFSLELARRYPKTNFIAIDVKSDRLYTSAKKALEEEVKNIVFLRYQLEPIMCHPELDSGSLHRTKKIVKPVQNDGQGVLGEIFGKNSVDEIWITFPDPYPKKRSAKHRLTHPSFLRQYRNILKETGSLKFKTDNRELFLWSLEQFVVENWLFNELSFDLHESNLPNDYKIMTYYEQKFTAQGIPTNFVSLSKV